jgi:DNA processing protein
MADEVVVVECRKRSGSMITVDYAIDLGVPVHAIPGQITSPLATGPNQLIQDGANPIIDIDLFIEEFLRRIHGR